MMVGRSTVGWWGGVQWDGGEEYSGMVGRSTVGWWGGEAEGKNISSGGNKVHAKSGNLSVLPQTQTHNIAHLSSP